MIAYVADYVAAHPDTLIGFLSLDPTQPGWEEELRDGHQELSLRGIKLLPMYAGFRPDEPRLDPLWRYAQRHRLPVLLHTGTTFVVAGAAGMHAAAAPRPGGDAVPRRADHHGPPRPSRTKASASSRSASIRTSMPTSAPCTTGRFSSITA